MAQSSNEKKSGPQGTMIFSPEEVEAAIQERLKVKLLAGDEGSMLVGITPPVDGKVFNFMNTSVTIGRNSDQDIVIDDPSVSAMHAKITLDNGSWQIANLLSSNGTFVNGKKISVTRLNNGDRVRFGKVEFVFKAGQLTGANGSVTSSTSEEKGKRTVVGYWLIGGLIVLGTTLYFLL